MQSEINLIFEYSYATYSSAFGSYTNTTEMSYYYFWNAVVENKIEYKGSKAISKPSDRPKIAGEKKGFEDYKIVYYTLP